jgi:hypothetical protein
MAGTGSAATPNSVARTMTATNAESVARIALERSDFSIDITISNH